MELFLEDRVKEMQLDCCILFLVLFFTFRLHSMHSIDAAYRYRLSTILGMLHMYTL